MEITENKVRKVNARCHRINENTSKLQVIQIETRDNTTKRRCQTPARSVNSTLRHTILTIILTANQTRHEIAATTSVGTIGWMC